MPPTTLKILVGTVTDTAHKVAQAIQFDCDDLIKRIDIVVLDENVNLDIFGNTTAILHLICTSTYKTGWVPDNAETLYQAFDNSPRYLENVRYGVISLGSRVYDTFAMGGKLFDEKLLNLGAQRVGDILCLDDCSDDDPEESAVKWARNWLGQASNM